MLGKLTPQALSLVGLSLLMLTVGVAPLVFNHFEEAELRARIDAAEAYLGKRDGQRESVADLRDAVAELEARANGSQQIVPSRPELAEALRGLTDALAGFEPEARSTETRPTRHYAKYSEIPLSVRFRGDFLSTYGALDAIESLPRLMRIDRLAIRRAADERDADRVETDVRMELSTFYAPEQEPSS